MCHLRRLRPLVCRVLAAVRAEGCWRLCSCVLTVFRWVLGSSFVAVAEAFRFCGRAGCLREEEALAGWRRNFRGRAETRGEGFCR